MPSKEVFPPRVRGCYKSESLRVSERIVSSSGARMLRVSMKRDVFTISLLLAYADAIVIYLPGVLTSGILVSYDIRRTYEYIV